jgi:hypothetical protein
MFTRNVAITVMISLGCITTIQLGLIIPSLYFGFLDEDSLCQDGTRGGLDLSSWNKGFGFEKIVLNVALYISALLGIYAHENFLVFGVVSLVLDFFFNIAWWIWGVVILSTKENYHCVAEGKGMAVMGIIDLVLVTVWFLHLKVANVLLNDTSATN